MNRRNFLARIAAASATTLFPALRSAAAVAPAAGNATRMKAQTIEIRSSHLSLISHPTEIADLIIRATSV